MAQQHDDMVPLLPDRFDGNGSADDWMSRSECVVEINGWNEAEKLPWLQAHMVGKAHVAYQNFSHETKNSYMLLKGALQSALSLQVTENTIR